MTVETSTYLSELNPSYPALGDAVSEGDDHIRKIKADLKATFPNFTAIPCTPSSVELNYVTGVTSAIQTQINQLIADDLSSALPGQTGNAGKFIKTDGSAASWVYPGLGYLGQVTASGSTVDFTSELTSTYDQYVIIATDILGSTATAGITAQIQQAATWQTAYGGYYLSASAVYTSVSGSAITIAPVNAGGTSSTNTVSFVLHINNPANANYWKGISWSGRMAGNTISPIGGGAASNTTGAMTGIRFAPTSSTFASGTFRIYGIANS